MVKYGRLQIDCFFLFLEKDFIPLQIHYQHEFIENPMKCSGKIHKSFFIVYMNFATDNFMALVRPIYFPWIILAKQTAVRPQAG